MIEFPFPKVVGGQVINGPLCYFQYFIGGSGEDPSVCFPGTDAAVANFDCLELGDGQVVGKGPAVAAAMVCLSFISHGGEQLITAK